MVLYEFHASISEMKNETITKIEGMVKGSEDIYFTCASGLRFTIRYDQDCCASCSVEDVIGDPEDLLNVPLIMAEDVSSDKSLVPDNGPSSYSETWTFIKFGTVKGYVTLRWYGSSNGYYSESPSIYKYTS